jgi:hypothetical protein
MCFSHSSSIAPYIEENLSKNDDSLAEMQNYWESKDEIDNLASSVWLCNICDLENPIGDNFCPKCLEPKMISEKSWPCPKCTFDNSCADSICFMCGQKMPANYKVNNSFERSECGIPGCSKDASHYGFCTKAHFDLAVEKNIISPCDNGIEVVFVGSSGDYTAHLLRSSHPRHISVKKQFLTSWAKVDVGQPNVERIYWIRMKPEILENFEIQKRTIGNVVRLFHGTMQSSKCLFGTGKFLNLIYNLLILI